MQTNLFNIYAYLRYVLWHVHVYADIIFLTYLQYQNDITSCLSDEWQMVGKKNCNNRIIEMVSHRICGKNDMHWPHVCYGVFHFFEEKTAMQKIAECNKFYASYNYNKWKNTAKTMKKKIVKWITDWAQK